MEIFYLVVHRFSTKIVSVATLVSGENADMK